MTEADLDDVFFCTTCGSEEYIADLFETWNSFAVCYDCYLASNMEFDALDVGPEEDA